MMMELVLRLLAMQPSPSSHGGLPCYSRRALSSRTRRDQSGPAQPTARSSCLPARPVQLPIDFPVPAGGRFGAIKTTERSRCMCMYATRDTDRYSQICTPLIVHMCLHAGSKYSHIHADMHIKCGAYVHVCRFEIQAHTCRYAHQT
jgi:hypothetical protein